MLARLTADTPGTVAPLVYFGSQLPLAFTQYALLFSKRFSLLGCRLQKLTPDLVEFITSCDEFPLDRISLAVESLLHLAQANPYRYTLPSPEVMMSILIVACLSKSFYSPRTVSARGTPNQ
jgi:hypothetical protein